MHLGITLILAQCVARGPPIFELELWRAMQNEEENWIIRLTS